MLGQRAYLLRRLGLGARPAFFPPLAKGGQGGWSRHNQLLRVQRAFFCSPSSRLSETVSKSDHAPGKQGGAVERSPLVSRAEIPRPSHSDKTPRSQPSRVRQNSRARHADPP